MTNVLAAVANLFNRSPPPDITWPKEGDQKRSKTGRSQLSSSSRVRSVPYEPTSDLSFGTCYYFSWGLKTVNVVRVVQMIPIVARA